MGVERRSCDELLTVRQGKELPRQRHQGTTLSSSLPLCSTADVSGLQHPESLLCGESVKSAVSASYSVHLADAALTLALLELAQCPLSTSSRQQERYGLNANSPCTATTKTYYQTHAQKHSN
ncbi:hypothetical protein MHYP_G00022180 [Metynnis hypsauchen]